jgi:hypothetical protein
MLTLCVRNKPFLDTSDTAFFRQNPPSGSDNQGRLLLIDETDHGYYVLKNTTEKKSYFIRRDQVIVIVYEQAE